MRAFATILLSLGTPLNFALLIGRTECAQQQPMSLGVADLSFCRRLPKVELHAHLHGSIPQSTLAELVQAKNALRPVKERIELPPAENRTLEDCFRIFDAIHAVVDSIDVVRRVTTEVVESFARDNVKYLDLRSTPRAVSGAGSQREYVQHVCEALELCKEAFPGIRVRLLLSVNRAGSLDEALETVAVAADRKRSGCEFTVGVDFSGNPTAKGFADFRAAFEAAKSRGLKIAAHVGEIEDEEDTNNILDFQPHRLGHAIVLSAEQERRLLAQPIPVEICPTSNCMCLGKDYAAHPTLPRWLQEPGFPLSINTDDTGVFATTLSEELHHVARAFGVRRDRLAELVLGALDQAFDDDEEALAKIRDAMRAEMDALLGGALDLH